MDENTFRTLITALITAQSIIVAVVVIWKQYWMSIYNLYTTQNEQLKRLHKDKNEELDSKCINRKEINYIWHISLFSSLLSWAAISAIIGVAFYIWSILCGDVIYLQIVVFGIGLGCSIFTMGIIIIVMLCTAIPNWTKARDNLEWGALNPEYINKYKYTLKALISKYQFPKDNKEIEKAVNQLKYRFILLVFISLLSGIVLSFVIFDIISSVFLLIPVISGVILIGPIIA
jgi:hypothetical protein